MARMNTYDLGLIQLRALRYRYATLRVALVGTIDGEPNFRISRSDGTLIMYRTWSQRDTTGRTKGGR